MVQIKWGKKKGTASPCASLPFPRPTIIIIIIIIIIMIMVVVVVDTRRSVFSASSSYSLPSSTRQQCHPGGCPRGWYARGRQRSHQGRGLPR